MPTVTVPQLFRELQVEPKPEDTWAVGNRVRDLYVKKSGQRPEKIYVPKLTAEAPTALRSTMRSNGGQPSSR
jgi:hypothetical protein